MSQVAHQHGKQVYPFCNKLGRDILCFCGPGLSLMQKGRYKNNVCCALVQPSLGTLLCLIIAYKHIDKVKTVFRQSKSCYEIQKKL